MFKHIRSICAAICIGILCASLSGCALFGSELDNAAKAAGKLVTFYCNNIPNEAVREQFRTAVNQHAAPNAVNVTCANGSAPLAVPSTNSGAHAMPTTNPHEKARLEARNKAIAEATSQSLPFDVASILGGHAGELQVLSERLDAWETLASSYNSQIASLESRIASLESTSSVHDSRITSLERRNG